MKKTMILAGVAGALALAGVAIAQTPSNETYNQQPRAPAASTPSADTSATDTAGTASDTAVNQAGERG